MILQGKTALISGGSRGIGRAISELFYKEGATIYIMARNAEKLAQAAKEIDVNNEGRVHAIPCDVGSKTSVDEAFARIKADGACIDILVNCAGVNLRGPLETMPIETWDKVIAINLTGTFLLTQNCFEMMKKKGGGKIVWGVVPTLDKEALEVCDLDLMVKKFRQSVNYLTKKGIDEKLIINNSLVSTSCGAGSLTTGLAEKAFRLTADLSKNLKAIYN